MSKANVISMYWEVGSHVPFSREITPSIIHAIQNGMYSMQFFLGNPKSFTRQRVNGADIHTSQILLEKYPTNVFSHFPYTSNLCGSVDSLAWSGDNMVDGKLTTLLSELSYELSVLSQFSESRSGVVIHPGCYSNIKSGLATIATSINTLTFTKNARLILENSAAEGRKLCKNFQEIKQVIDQVTPSKRDHVGVCVDTAHVWGAGLYDLSLVSEVDRMFDEFSITIGIDRFTLLHLNDSCVPFGSRKDRHESLKQGQIWGSSHESLVYLLNKCKEHEIPMVLETPGFDMLTLAQIQPE